MRCLPPRQMVLRRWNAIFLDTSVETLPAALRENSLPMLVLNTWPGDREAGDFGLAALPGRKAEARDEIARAIAYAAATGTKAVHVMAGRTDGGTAAEDCFRAVSVP